MLSLIPALLNFSGNQEMKTGNRDSCSFFLTAKWMLQYYKGHFHIPCRSGETGRRTGLKIQRAYAHVGSTPTSGTTE